MRNKKQLSFFDKLILWLNFMLCASLLISYLAPISDPAKYWVIAFFGLAYPILLTCNLLLILYWILRGSAWMLVSIICIATGWNILNKNIGFRSETAVNAIKDTGMIRVMTYNVHDFKRYGANNDISTKHEILQIISEQQPDLIGFEEFFSRRHGQYDMVDSIKKILHTNNYYFEAFQENQTEAIGMAIFSKYPIMAHGLIKLSTDKNSINQCLYVDVQKGNQMFRMYGVHLQSIRFDPEDYKYLSEISGVSKPNTGSAKRLGSKLKTAFIKRSIQVVKIKDHAKGCPYPYIIAGDFNDTPTSFAVDQMNRGLKNAFIEKGSGFGRTYNGNFPNYQIDYIMASSAFNVVNYNIIEKKLSDHYPVRSDLWLK
jgi:endonuclease/exonuclease/phosphatase family metal-dependent hydrolase